MQAFFYEIADYLEGLLDPGEDIGLWFEAEESDFVRFGGGRVRQPGSVQQCSTTLALVDSARIAYSKVTLHGAWKKDRARLRHALDQLREMMRDLPADPRLVFNREGFSSEVRGADDAPSRAMILEDIVDSGLDLVGIYASGEVRRAYASSRGHRNWFSSHSHLVDVSSHLPHGGAIKITEGGEGWDRPRWQRRLEEARTQLELLRKDRVELSPGTYDVFLEPPAVAALLQVMGRGLGVRAQRSGRSPWGALARGEERLSPIVSLSECPGRGRAPGFGPEGFAKPERLPLIAKGKLEALLVSARSGREYEVPHNGADPSELPETLELEAGPGCLENPTRGLRISHLHYLNYSDLTRGRVTGLTRFASFLVEDGSPVAPIDAMRFDDSLYRMFGEGLQGLGSETRWIPSADTYGGRSLASVTAPAARIDGLRVAL